LSFCALQDVAIHRKRAKRSSDPVENEQFRRAFWWCVPTTARNPSVEANPFLPADSLYALEREWSGFLGRPFLLAEEECVIVLSRSMY
jgi:hypothetical protein